VFTSPHIDTTIYEGPIIFFNQKLDQIVLKKMGVESRHADMRPWHSVMERFEARRGKVRIGIVGMYIELHDAYKSLYEALFHAGLECGVDVELVKLDFEALDKTDNVDSILNDGRGNIDGILIPGSSGERRISGMVKAAAWARENKIPYLGICLGMYVILVEWFRNEMKAEFAGKSNGEAMQLGTGETVIEEGTHLFSAYGEKRINERRRHSFDFSNINEIDSSGLKIAGFNSGKTAIECIEWPADKHPWGVGVLFNPEYKSNPMAASPLFRDFVSAVRKCQKR